MKNLLIVDDEPSLRLILKEYFKQSFNLVILENGRRCLEYLESNPIPEILIIDWIMPDITGLDVIKILRAQSKFDKMGIIVLSGKNESKDRIECLNVGADDFVIKPFNPEELQARINAILRSINANL